jgi:outer membrane protein TolC
MRDADQDAPPALTVPSWLEALTIAAMQQAVNRALTWNPTAETAAEAAREVARAHLPAATMGMIAEAVAAVLPDPEGLATGAPTWRGEPLSEASAEEVAATLSYAMRFDERGKPRRTGHEYAVGMAARQLAVQLALSNFVVMRRPPVVRHGPGGP